MEDSQIPSGAIPVDQFQVAESAQSSGSMPAGAIPMDQFESSEDAYGTEGQMLKAGLEGAAKGVLGSTLATAAETNLLDVDPKDIEGRERENPITHGAGMATSLGAGLLTGLGPEAMLMTKAGQMAAGLTTAGKLTGAALEAAPLASRIGSSAIQQAAEMAIMTADDEIAKKIWTDPEGSAEQAISNIGLSAALGGAGGAFVTGAISPLWKATVGPGVESFLGSLSGKLGGNASNDMAISTAKGLGDAAGIDLSKTPAVAAKINGDPIAADLFSKLSQTDTTHYGKQVQNELAQVTNEVGSKIAETLGKDAEHVSNLETKLDKYTRGNEIAETLHNEIEQVAKPINEAYDAVNTQFRASPVSIDSKRAMAQEISQKALDNGWYKAADDSQKTLLDRVLKKLPQQETAEDLKLFMTNLRESHPYGSSTYQAAKDISSIMKGAQERAVMEGIVANGGNEAMGAEALAQYQGLKGQYAKLMDTVDGLNEHLHVGKYYGPQSFLNNLKELGTTNAEGVLNRLSGATKADTLNILQQFPETLGKIRDFHVDNVLNASKGADGIDPRKFAKQYDNLSPQLKNLVADSEQQMRLKALGELMSKTNDATHNWSNTARTMDKLTNGLISPTSMLVALLEGSGAGILTHFGTLGLKEGSDALRYGMLKFLSSGQPIKAEAFHSMVQMMDRTIKGEAALNKAVESVFKAGAEAAVTAPSPASIAKLDKFISKSDQDPNDVPNKILASQTGHYLPNHQVALSKTTMNALSYLKSIKPQDTKLSPLQPPIPPTPAQEARYNRALTIAENPNVIFKHIKDGTLQTSDIKDLNGIYPALYPKMQEKLMNTVVNRSADAEPVPYKARIGISLFMQHPLDPTMTPQGIMSAQPKPPPQSPQQQKAPGSNKRGTTNLGKSNDSYKTPGQSAESDRSDR